MFDITVRLVALIIMLSFIFGVVSVYKSYIAFTLHSSDISVKFIIPGCHTTANGAIWATRFWRSLTSAVIFFFILIFMSAL